MEEIINSVRFNIYDFICFCMVYIRRTISRVVIGQTALRVVTRKTILRVVISQTVLRVITSQMVLRAIMDRISGRGQLSVEWAGGLVLGSAADPWRASPAV